MRAPSLLATALAVSGCIERVDLGFELSPETRTVMLELSSGRTHVFPAGEIDLLSADRPEEVVLLAQTIDELQISAAFDRDPTAPRSPPQPNLGALTNVGEDTIDWEAIESTIRLPDFDPAACAAAGCPEGEWGAEWCKTGCDPPPPNPPAVPQVECDACDLVRAPPPACAIGEARFAAEEDCAPLGDCNEDFPQGAVFVRPGAAGGDGSRAQPFGSIAEAIGSGAIIALEAGTHASPGSVSGVRLVGVCAALTTIAGDLSIDDATAERVHVEGILTAAGDTEVTAADLDQAVVIGPSRWSRVAVRGPVLVGFGALTGASVSLVDEGITCASAEVSLTDVVAEIASGAGIAAANGCSVHLERAFLRGGSFGVHTSTAATLEATDLEVRDADGAGLFLSNDSTLEGVRVYDSFTGVYLGGGTYDVQDLAIVRSGSAITSNSFTRSTTARIERAFLRDNPGGGLRMLSERAWLDVIDLVVEDPGVTTPQGDWHRPIEIAQGVTATISRARVTLSGPIVVYSGPPVRFFDLTIETPRDVAARLIGESISLERARISASLISTVSLFLGHPVDEVGGLIELTDVELFGPSEFTLQAIRVASGSLRMRRFRIAELTTGIAFAVDPRSLDVRDGVIEGNVSAVVYTGSTVPRFFNTAFRGNGTDFTPLEPAP